MQKLKGKSFFFGRKQLEAKKRTTKQETKENIFGLFDYKKETQIKRNLFGFSNSKQKEQQKQLSKMKRIKRKQKRKLMNVQRNDEYTDI